MHPSPDTVRYLTGALIFTGILVMFIALAAGLTPEHRLFPRTRLPWLARLRLLHPRILVRLIRTCRRLRWVWLVFAIALTPTLAGFALFVRYAPRA